MKFIDEHFFTAIALAILIIALFGVVSIWMTPSKRGKK